MFNPHTKFKVYMITCNEDMKGKCKISRGFRVHLWLNGTRIIDFILMIIELFQ